MVYWPGKQPQTYSQLTSHVDVVPTLMQEVFSCSNALKDYSNGQSLFDLTERKFVIVNNWSNQAIVNRKNVKVFPNIGASEYRDYDTYQLQPEQQKGQFPMAEVIESISRFYQ